jgi:hypothetical protein
MIAGRLRPGCRTIRNRMALSFFRRHLLRILRYCRSARVPLGGRFLFRWIPFFPPWLPAYEKRTHKGFKFFYISTSFEMPVLKKSRLFCGNSIANSVLAFWRANLRS